MTKGRRIYLQHSTLEQLQNCIAGCINQHPGDQKFLYEKYYGVCLKTVFRYVYRHDKAIDVVNDGFVKIFLNFSKFQFADNGDLEMMLMGWMRKIMINTAIDFLRKNNFIPEIGDISEKIWLQENRSSASDQKILYKEIIQQIKRLPPAYRTVFNMYIIDGFSHQEIATQLGIAVGTSKSNLSKARVIMQKFIKSSDRPIEYAASK